jgi:hypothetical protein
MGGPASPSIITKCNDAVFLFTCICFDLVEIPTDRPISKNVMFVHFVRIEMIQLLIVRMA